MGDGIADGFMTPNQPGVIVREGENFPIIPRRLLKLTPDQLQERIDHLIHAAQDNTESSFPDLELEEQLETTRVVYEFAKTAVERNQQAAKKPTSNT